MPKPIIKFGNKLRRNEVVNQIAGKDLLTDTGVGNVIHPGGKVLSNVEEGNSINGRNLIDPSNAILMEPPKPPPRFPDVEGAALAARRNVRRRGVSSGVGSTILTGGYSATGQASGSLGG